jgi:hypothetical protein
MDVHSLRLSVEQHWRPDEWTDGQTDAMNVHMLLDERASAPSGSMHERTERIRFNYPGAGFVTPTRTTKTHPMTITFILVDARDLQNGCIRCKWNFNNVETTTSTDAGESDRNFPCQTLKIRKVSLVVMGS